jgi:uncharacterized protein YcbK (DUF882 family)
LCLIKKTKKTGGFMSNYKLTPDGLKKIVYDYPFNSKVLECKCRCGLMNADPHLLSRLQALQEKLHVSLEVTSGCRCPEHNRKVSGAPASLHMSGKAADVKSPKHDPVTIAINAWSVGFRGIIVYKTFCHIDIRHKVLMQLNLDLFHTPVSKLLDDFERAGV